LNSRAEACAVVVLKRLEDAERDGDRILAIVRGSAVNNDGTGTSFGTPNGAAQEKVYRAALKRARVKAKDVSYIETHGTGTPVGKFRAYL
jgi:acyl transferase domain-containing protein